MNEPQRFLVCGMCPLPFENTSQNYGPGIRTWQLARGLALDGHEVRVVAMAIPDVYERGELVAESETDGVGIRRFDMAALHDHSVVQAEIDDWKPAALVGATVYGSLALAQAEPRIPFWADHFGHVMAEAQVKAAFENENWPVPRWWRMALPVLSRADRISTVSQAQRHAVIGELGAIGRLTAETCGYEFTAVIPCGLHGTNDAPQPGQRRLRGEIVPEDAFVTLWSGGYNVWSDVDTLFEGLATAMEADPAIHFVSTGGAIGGHDEVTYERFRSMIASSSHRSRFHLAGWLKREEVPSYVAGADVGVLADRPSYEGMLGSKNRIVEWLEAGLPAVYNQVGDLGDYLAAEDVGLTFPVGDAKALADRLLWAAGHRDELEAMARRGREACRRDFSLEKATEELREWAVAPSHAPDHRPGALRSPFDFGEAPSASAPQDPQAPDPQAPEPLPPEPLPRDPLPPDPLRTARGLGRRLKAGLKRLVTG